MRFYELLQQVSFPELWAALGGTEDEAQQEARQEYQTLYDTLKSTPAGENTNGMRIVLEIGYDYWGENEEGYLQANGYVPDDEEPYALGFRPEGELLAMEVDPKTAADYSPAQIAAQVLADYAYDTAAARTVWNDQAVGAVSGLYESETCMDGHAEGSLTDTRRELGLDRELSNKEKYGFLF